MKKIVICIFLLFALLIFPGICENKEIASMTFEEIQAEIDKCNINIWNAYPWAEVMVPMGKWIVGADIPQGKYHVSCADIKCSIELYPAGEEVGNWRSTHPRYIDMKIPSSWGCELELIDGDTLIINYGGMTFTSIDYVPTFSTFNNSATYPTEKINYYHDLCEELQKRPEWEAVRVPAGEYWAPKQIPIGKWTVWPEDRMLGTVYHTIYEQERYIDQECFAMVSENRSTYEKTHFIGRANIVVTEGDMIKVPDKPVIFTPYAGNVLFDFIR